MASKKQPQIVLGDDGADYKSTCTDGMDGAGSYVPTEYSGEVDYRSTYSDDNASVFSRLTGMEGTVMTMEQEGNVEETASVISTSSSRKKKKRKRKPSQSDDATTDYKSDDMGRSKTVVPSESPEDKAADYTHTYSSDEASVYSGIEGAETASVYSEAETATTEKKRRSKRKKRRPSEHGLREKDDDYKSTFTANMDGAETVISTEYQGGGETVADYLTMYNEDNATVFSGLTGAETVMEGTGTATTAYSQAETTTGTKKRSKKRKQSQSRQREDADDYKSTFTTGMDGAETIVPAEYLGGGEPAADYLTMYNDDNATVFSGLTGMEGVESAYLSDAPVPPIPTICHSDVDSNVYDKPLNEGAETFVDSQTDFQSAGGAGINDAESVYSNVIVEGNNGPETLYNSIYVGEIKGPKGNVQFDDSVTCAGEGEGQGTVYGAGAAETVYDSNKGTIVPKHKHHLALPFDTLFGSEDWVTYTLGFLFFLLLGCFGSIYYLSTLSVITDDATELRLMVSNLTAELESMQQRHMHTMQETSQLESEMQVFPNMITSLQQNLSRLQAQKQQTEELASILADVGKTPSTAIRSCAGLPPYYGSGLYYVSSSNGPPVQVYCDREFNCKGRSGGWIKVAEFDAMNSSHSCPPGFEIRVFLGARACYHRSSKQGCYLAVFNRLGIRYKEVCGRVIGYPVGHVNAFSSDRVQTIDSFYVDGIVLSHGRGLQMTHIWTFAAAQSEDSSEDPLLRCPCLDFSDDDVPKPPSFVGNDYFCEAGGDPLWDGRGCRSGNLCCDFNLPPWFYSQLSAPTSDTLDMWLCRNQPAQLEDVGISMIELYVQ